MGHTRDATMEYNLQIEQKRHQDIVRLDIIVNLFSQRFAEQCGPGRLFGSAL